MRLCDLTRELGHQAKTSDARDDGNTNPEEAKSLTIEDDKAMGPSAVEMAPAVG